MADIADYLKEHLKAEIRILESDIVHLSVERETYNSHPTLVVKLYGDESYITQTKVEKDLAGPNHTMRMEIKDLSKIYSHAKFTYSLPREK